MPNLISEHQQSLPLRKTFFFYSSFILFLQNALPANKRSRPQRTDKSNHHKNVLPIVFKTSFFFAGIFVVRVVVVIVVGVSLIQMKLKLKSTVRWWLKAEWFAHTKRGMFANGQIIWEKKWILWCDVRWPTITPSHGNAQRGCSCVYKVSRLNNRETISTKQKLSRCLTKWLFFFFQFWMVTVRFVAVPCRVFSHASASSTAVLLSTLGNDITGKSVAFK